MSGPAREDHDPREERTQDRSLSLSRTRNGLVCNTHHDFQAFPWPSFGSWLMTQQARWHISCDRVFRMRSSVKRQSSSFELHGPASQKRQRRRPDLPLESRILVASSIDVVCTPSLDLFSTKKYEPNRKSGTCDTLWGKPGNSTHRCHRARPAVVKRRLLHTNVVSTGRPPAKTVRLSSSKSDCA